MAQSVGFFYQVAFNVLMENVKTNRDKLSVKPVFRVAIKTENWVFGIQILHIINTG